MNITHGRWEQQEPMAFLNMAREYFRGAECLAEHGENVWNPMHQLFFHTMELLLKAYLRGHGLPIDKRRRHHGLVTLYKECKKLGLVVDRTDKFDVLNIASLLEKGNVDQGFRYFHLKGTAVPDPKWTRDVVGKLVQTVASFLNADSDANRAPGVARKLVMVIGKPQSKSMLKDRR